MWDGDSDPLALYDTISHHRWHYSKQKFVEDCCLCRQIDIVIAEDAISERIMRNRSVRWHANL